MKQIPLIMLIFLISLSATANSYPQNIAEIEKSVDYRLEINTSEESNIEIVTFFIPQDSFVKLIITDKSEKLTETLVDGDVDKGEHCMYFNTNFKKSGEIYILKMEIYESEYGSIKFSKEIKLKEN